MDSATPNQNVAHLVDYLSETKHLPHDDQIRGLYARWPDITPAEYVTALKLFHKRERAARKPAKRKLPQILARLKDNIRLHDQGHLHGCVLEKSGRKLVGQGKLESVK